jgi:hypothetical protein
MKGPGSPTNREKLPKNRPGIGIRPFSVPVDWHKPLECGNSQRLWRETRKGQTGCWSGPDLNRRAPSYRALSGFDVHPDSPEKDRPS